MTNDCCKIQDYLQSFDAAQTFCDVVVVIVVVDVVVAAVAVVVDDDAVVIEILRAYDLYKLDPTCHCIGDDIGCQSLKLIRFDDEDEKEVVDTLQQHWENLQDCSRLQPQYMWLPFSKPCDDFRPMPFEIEHLGHKQICRHIFHLVI